MVKVPVTPELKLTVRPTAGKCFNYYYIFYILYGDIHNHNIKYIFTHLR